MNHDFHLLLKLRFLVQMCRLQQQHQHSEFRSACADVSDAPLNQLFSNTHVEETCDHEIILWTWSLILVGGLWPQDIPQVQLTEGFHLLVHLQGKKISKNEKKIFWKATLEKLTKNVLFKKSWTYINLSITNLKLIKTMLHSKNL